MSDELSVELVIDGYTLSRLLSVDEDSALLLAWINKIGTKAVVPKRGWNNVRNKVRQDCKDMEETFIGVMASLRGIATPYRDKYATEAGIQTTEDEDTEDEVDEEESITLKKIVNRHYATVRYVVVERPAIYKDDNIKIKPERIVDLVGFYKSMAIEDSEFVKEFRDEYAKGSWEKTIR